MDKHHLKDTKEGVSAKEAGREFHFGRVGGKKAEFESVSPVRKSSELHSVSRSGTSRLYLYIRTGVSRRYIKKVLHNLEEKS